MKKKKGHKRQVAYKTVCGRCGNDIRPRAKFCMCCQLRVKDAGDIIRVRVE